MAATDTQQPEAWTIEDVETGKVPLVSGDQREVEQYIADVYTHLTGLMLMAAMGAYVQLQSGILSFWMPFLGALGCLMYVMYGGNKVLRAIAFCAFGWLDGWTLGVLIYTLQTPPGTLLTAIALTVAIFACFSISARYAKRRSYLSMGGVLGSALVGLLIVSVASIFLQWRLLYAAVLYGGLILFSFYVAYDTQVMIERAHLGQRDTMGDAINLFIDFMAILRRILIILSEANNN